MLVRENGDDGTYLLVAYTASVHGVWLPSGGFVGRWQSGFSHGPLLFAEISGTGVVLVSTVYTNSGTAFCSGSEKNVSLLHDSVPGR